MAELFLSAKLKVKWSEHHIAELEKEFRVFVKAHSHAASLTQDPESGHFSFNLKVGKQPPVRFALLVADIIHNLRTALDHANWELRGLDGGIQNRHTKLPIAGNRISYEASCSGIKTPRDDLPGFFKALEFFKGGAGELIYFLHDLDVKDKHIVLPIQTIRSIKTSLPAGKGILKISIPDAMERLRSSPNDEQESDPILDICFGKVDGFKFEPVIPTLMRFADAVKHVVGRFEAFVSARK